MFMSRYFFPAIVILIASILPFSMLGQTFREKNHKNNIRTVRIHKEGEALSPPVIQLNAGEKVSLGFDDMEGGRKNFSYKLIHCNAWWQPSDLFESDYLAGQYTGEMYDAQNSFNTLISYTHYQLSIPNKNMKPMISGNYILMVYSNNHPEDTVLTRKFRITENLVSVRGKIEKINRMSREKPNQELNLTLEAAGIHIDNPYNNIKIAVQQNYHQENLHEYMRPSSMKGNNISYQMNKKLIFKGCNEFHHFNSKSTSYPGEHIKSITFENEGYQFLLNTDHDRTFEPYKIKKDLNGRFMIDIENSDHPETEADYVYVHFTLKTETSPAEGNVYIMGGFNNWKCQGDYKMSYRAGRKAFYNVLLMKQGYYDYKYVFKTPDGIQPCYISGNHAQAENDYLIYIYYRDHAKGYDRLTGYTLINSSESSF
jgi:hypothetical protein